MQINSKDQLRRLYSAPAERVIRKELSQIDHHMERFISLSPFFVIASSNAQQQMDASPRGGKPGFVKVTDQNTLLIPDALGNNRLDTLENIIATGQVGLLFFMPGIDEMVRINGQASLHTDDHLIRLFEDMQNKTRLVIKVSVHNAYMHCAKAAMRSQLWNSANHLDRRALPTMGQLIKEHARLDTPAETQDEMLKRYEKELWHSHSRYKTLRISIPTPQTSYLNDSMAAQYDLNYRTGRFCIFLTALVFLFVSAAAFAEAFFSDSNATGFFVSRQGHLVTAYHAIENRQVSVVLPDGRAVPATVIKQNKEADLALLKIEATTPFLSVALPDNIQVGLEIMTIGYPMISVQGSSAKVSRGIINSLVGFHDDKSSFQFDAATARGNSGGPVIGPGGLVVGVVNGKLHTTKVLERTKEWIVNVNYATNVATLIKFLGGVDGGISTKQMQPDAPLQIQKLFAEIRSAVVLVVSDMSAMQAPSPKESE